MSRGRRADREGKYTLTRRPDRPAKTGPPWKHAVDSPPAAAATLPHGATPGGDRGPPGRRPGSGSWLVLGLVALGVTAGATAIAYQRGQTRRCLAFYGSDVARRVAEAPQVEVWTLAPSDTPGRLRAVGRRDVSRAPGLVHLRRGLVEDANFRWPGVGEEIPSRLPARAWDVALVFSDPARPDTTAVLVIDTATPGAGDDGAGWLAVVGRPGRMGLGRIGAGLGKWLADLPSGR